MVPRLRGGFERRSVLQCAHVDGQTERRSAADDVDPDAELPTAVSHPFNRRFAHLYETGGLRRTHVNKNATCTADC
jgi:hypothetical protein